MVEKRGEQPKFMKSKVSSGEESQYVSAEYGSFSSSAQYTAMTNDGPGLFGSINSSSSVASSRTYGLPIHRAVVVVANAALGAGMLNFPQAYYKSGGLVNALTVQTVSWACSWEILNCAKACRNPCLMQLF